MRPSSLLTNCAANNHSLPRRHAQLERCRRLEREGEQVLSSLANVSQRLPLLLRDTNATSSSSSSSASSPTAPATADEAGGNGVMGVLSFCVDAQSLLLRRHFGALEKSMAFLRDIVREFADVLRRMKTFVAEHAELQDELEPVASDESGDRSALVLAQQGEWMEDVLAMYEHELRRKRLLVTDIEYHDAAHIARRHARWSARGAQSCVDHRYGACVCVSGTSLSGVTGGADEFLACGGGSSSRSGAAAVDPQAHSVS